MKNLFICIVVSSFVMGSLSVVAANNYLTGAAVNKLRSYQKDQFGGCVFGLSINVNTEGGNPGGITCEKDYLVTADCSGRVRAKADGQRMWETAQIAFVTGKTVDIIVSDDEDLVSGDGYCIAKQVYIAQD